MIEELSKQDLVPLTNRTKWLQLVYRSDLSVTTKLVASVIKETCMYQSKHKMQLSSISAYSISRILKSNSAEVQPHLDLLFDNGWLYDTEIGTGAKKVYGLTFKLKPDKKIRT